MRTWNIALALALLLTIALPRAQPAPPFQVEEATIAGVHAAMQAGRLTCRALVEAYLRRIEAYDRNGPALNAIVVVNPEARSIADERDRRFRERGPWARCTACRQS